MKAKSSTIELHTTNFRDIFLRSCCARRHTTTPGASIHFYNLVFWSSLLMDYLAWVSGPIWRRGEVNGWWC